MNLTPGQLSSLNEMGIPVWALRTENSEQESNEPRELVLQGDCLILVESHSNEQQTQRLLQAMLYSIGLRPEQVAIISADQLPQLQNSAGHHKLLLVLGEGFAQSLWGKLIVRGKPQKIPDSQIPAVISFSLDELLATPQNKALVWADLNLVKKSLNAL